MAEKSGSVLKADLHALFEEWYAHRVDSHDIVQFIAEGRSVDSCHAWAAELHSPVIRRMLNSPMREASTRQIQLSSNDEIAVLPAIVRFFYGFNIEICGFENAVQLLKFAEFYDIAQLKTQCSAWLASQDMIPAECFQIVAELSFDDVLVARAWSILENEPRNMFQSDAWPQCSLGMVHAVLDRGLNCSEMDIFKAALCWHEHQTRTGRPQCTSIEGSGVESHSDLVGTTCSSTTGAAELCVAMDWCTEPESTDVDSTVENLGDSVNVGPSDVPPAALETPVFGLEEGIDDLLEMSGKSSERSMEDMVLEAGDSPPSARKEVVVGAIVTVLEEFKSASTKKLQIRKRDVGRVRWIDTDGDANVSFEKAGVEWVFRSDYGKLKVVAVTESLEQFNRAVMSRLFDHSLEEQRWQWYRGDGILNFAGKLPASLTQKVLFEHMAPAELHSCKRFLPLEDYVSHLEVACKLKPAVRVPRAKPTQYAL